MSEIITSEEYNKAVALHRRICANAQSAQESLYEMCKGLKEMRDDKLYKELGYQNFEDYTENEVGIKRRQAYSFIKIAETYGENVQSIAQIGTTKLALLCTLSDEQREEIQQNTDLENATVKDLEQKIAALKAENNRISKEAALDRKEQESANAAAERYKYEAKRKGEENQRLEDRVDSLSEKLKIKENKIVELSGQIRELENRPVEIAVQSNMEELERLKAEYEEKLSATKQPEDTVDTKEIFKAYFSNVVDSVDRLFNFVGLRAEKMYIDQLMKLSDMIQKKASNVIIKEN